jgi:hypothetical protein
VIQDDAYTGAGNDSVYVGSNAAGGLGQPTPTPAYAEQHQRALTVNGQAPATRTCRPDDTNDGRRTATRHQQRITNGVVGSGVPPGGRERQHHLRGRKS